MTHDTIRGVTAETRRLDGWGDVDVSSDETEYISTARYSLLTSAGDWIIWVRPKRVDDPETMEETGFIYPPRQWEVKVSGPDSTWSTKLDSLDAVQNEVGHLIDEIRAGCVTEKRAFMSDQ